MRWVLLDASALTDVDYSAGIQLKDLANFLQARDIEVGLVRADVELLATMMTYEVVGEGAPTQTFPTISQGNAAFEADQGAGHP